MFLHIEVGYLQLIEAATCQVHLTTFPCNNYVSVKNR